MSVHAEQIGNYIASSQIPFILFDFDGLPLHINDAAKQIIKRISPEQDIFTATNVWSQIEKLCSEENCIKLRFLIEQKTPYFTFELQIPGKDIGQLWLKFIFSLHANGDWLVLIDDVTQQKLKEHHLVSAKEDAEKASTTRSQFLANISHEIRTPIQTIIGMVELLADTRLDEEQMEYTRQVRFSADVLLTLINDILDLSKGEAGLLKIEKISFDLVDCIEKTIDLVSIEAHRKGLELVIDFQPQVPETVIGDPGRLRQVILNLVKNAVKFTAQGMVCVRVSIHKIPDSSIEENHEYILVEVIDTGIGISYEARARLFTLFYQADSSTSRRFGGTGLGLAISKNIVTLMNGDIGMKSNDPAGSNFWFHIPLVRPLVSMETVHKPTRPGMRILLVDDNEATLASLCRTFAGLGYTHISQATSGMFALAMLHSAEQARRPFDITFIDMVMPEMDGWRLAAEINKNRAINQVQLYLMVPEGSIGADAKMKLLEWFNGYLYKPVKRRMLVQLMDEQLQSSIDLEVVDDQHTINSEISNTAPSSEPRITPAKAEEQPRFLGLSVLIVEDHPVNQKLLRIFLEKAGCTVTTANDGTEALDAVHQSDFSVVFMDIQMPKLNGYLATKELRNRGFKKPVIACTASAQEDEREQCLSYGMDDILTKPFRRQDVLNALGKWHNKQRGNATMKNDDQEAVLDFPLLLEIVMNDIDSARSLISEFLDQTRKHIVCLERAITDGELQTVHQMAHLIKGSALNVTARQLATSALFLEQNAKTATPDDLRKSFAELHHAFSRFETKASNI